MLKALYDLSLLCFNSEACSTEVRCYGDWPHRVTHPCGMGERGCVLIFSADCIGNPLVFPLVLHASLLAFFVCFFILFHPCGSHAQRGRVDDLKFFEYLSLFFCLLNFIVLFPYLINTNKLYSLLLYFN